MPKLNFYTFALQISSADSIVSLPIKMSAVSRMRIKSLRYTTASTGNIFMLINVQGWTNNSIFYDGNNIIPYTKWLLIPPSIGTPILFDNPYNTSFDVIQQNPISSITSFRLIFSINNDNTISNDISTSNPIYIEIYVEGQDNIKDEPSLEQI